VSLLVLTSLTPAVAATFVAPRDYAELARQADAIVLAEAGPSVAVARGSLIFTDTTFEIIAPIAGQLIAAERIDVRAPGGELDGRVWAVPGAPRFEIGARYLLCLRQSSAAVWQPMMLSYGIFRERADADGRAILVPDGELNHHRSLPRPDGDAVDPIVTVDKTKFLSHLRETLRRESDWDLGTVRVEVSSSEGGADEGGGAGVPAECSFIGAAGRNFRWREFDTGGSATMFSNSSGDPSLSHRGFPLVQEAMDMWMSVTDSSFNLRYGGALPIGINCSGGTDVAPNFILFDDPCSDIADLENCSGVLAFGGPNGNASHTFDGERWNTADTWIVVVNNGVGCLGDTNYRVMLAHELGHGLGFGHLTDDGALMFSNCCRNVNSTDRLCARFTYPPIDPQNDRPTVDAGGDRDLLLLGNAVPLSGTVNDDELPTEAELTTTWTQLTGPGSVEFEDASSLDTIARFSHSGSYLLGLEAYDGELLRIDTFLVDVEVFAGHAIELSFQQGVDGYGGTVDTVLNEGDPDADLSSADSLDVDTDSPGGSGFAKQSLLRFEGIFGDANDGGRIPAGAAIRSASLELRTTNSGDGASIHEMEEEWSDRASWNSFGGDGVQAGDEARSARVAQVLGTGDPTRVDVTSSLQAWSDDPPSNLGWAFLPRDSNGWDFDSAQGEVPPRLVVELPIVERNTLIEVGDEWLYRPGNTAVPARWNELGFEPDDEWRGGPSGLGFADGDDATIITGMQGSYVTLYCRHEFEVDGPIAISDLSLRIDYDDGFVAYINGVEVARSLNMGAPGSPVNRQTLPTSSREAGVVEEFALDAGVIGSGTNVLAIEIHNATISSSDLSLIPSLVSDRLLVSPTTTWSFLRGAQPPPADWSDPDFDAATWERGRASIGYGGLDDFTVLDDMRGNYASVFCRAEFDVDCPLGIDSLLWSGIVDDGAVVYLNGEEIGRINMPAGVVTHESLATRQRSGRANLDVPADLLSELLRTGRNVLAVSVHNASLNSSDLTFTSMLVPFLDDTLADDCEMVAPRFLRGDASGDGRLNVSDAVRLLTALFRGGVTLDCPDAADKDDDGALTLTDAVGVLNFLFQAGSPPAAPGTECGEDPTPDTLAACERPDC
jgi:hypothetical protein